ncbi:7286_t:CDS:1 [Gigaspora margarita]|uniref:7286_t:CDS:1 n=1 Tax=Gigaspora margarita TaxID=4874 RepID=A0ABN7W4R6_GIGMA|nr:7286_t:CDS:1 [Gigaspora margarita]
MNLNKYINLKLDKDRLLNDTSICSKNIKNSNYIVGSLSYYKDLYEKLSKQYSLLLSDIRVNQLYFDRQKQTNSNSLFYLLYKLKKRENNSYDIEEAQKQFENVKSPRFSSLTNYFKDIVKQNPTSKIYYRYNSNCDVTNHLSLESFNLSKESTLKSLAKNYDLVEWF